MKIAIGCDHAGVDLKNKIIKKFKKDIDFINCGVDTEESCDYPDIALKVCKLIQNKKVDKGILICGSGIGMSIASNKCKGIRSTVCTNKYMAEYCRKHNDANVICLGARMISKNNAYSFVDIFIKTAFEGGRHQRRIDKITNMENNN